MKQEPCNFEYFTYLKFLANPFSGKSAPICQNIGPKTRNVVYGVRCLQCQVLYIGETKNSLEERIKQHRYKIRKLSKDGLLYIHFQTHTLDNLQTFGLESKRDWTTFQRKRAEKNSSYEIFLNGRYISSIHSPLCPGQRISRLPLSL